MPLYRIADLLVEMDTFGRTLRQAEPYRVQDASADADIMIRHQTPEQAMMDALGPGDAEYMVTARQFYAQLLGFDGMMLHASCVVMDDKAYLFSAPSGTGKSTHTQLWMQVFGTDRAQILNDDKPALRCVDGVWYAYGTPWVGKGTETRNLRFPIGGICVLRRGETNSIEKMPPQKAVFEILNQTVRLKNPVAMELLLELIDRLVSQVPVYELHCNMEPEAALLSHSVMSQESQI